MAETYPWRVALYDRLDNGKPSRYTFDILGFNTRKEARDAARNYRRDPAWNRRVVPRVEKVEQP